MSQLHSLEPELGVMLKDSRKSKMRKKQMISIAMFILSKHVVVLDPGGNLSKLIYKIQASVISVSAALKQHALVKHFRGYTSIESERESLAKLCEIIFLNALSSSGATCIIASFRCENEYYVQENLRGDYVVTFVPLDGDLENPTSPLGSIFSIYRRSRTGKLMDLELMQPGRCMIACGYALYGPITTLVMAFGHGIGAHLFTLDPDSEDFYKTTKKLNVPKRGKYYSINEGLCLTFDRNIMTYIKMKKDVKKVHLTNECILTGSLVADFHTIIKHGGILLKPAFKDIPEGKFYLQFHLNPLAFIMLEAGGLATDGKKEITVIEVTKPRQRSPLYCGSVQDISELVRFTANMKNFKI